MNKRAVDIPQTILKQSIIYPDDLHPQVTVEMSLLVSRNSIYGHCISVLIKFQLKIITTMRMQMELKHG